MHCIGRTKGWLRCRNRGNHLFGTLCHQHRFQPLKLFLWFIGTPVATFLAIWGVWLAVESYRDGRQLREELGKIQSALSDKFDEQYPLGYCLIAVTGNKRTAISPRLRSMVRIDWDAIRLEKMTNTSASFVIPEMEYLPQRAKFTDLHVGVKTEPGAHRVILESPHLYGEIKCIRTLPVGTAFIVGFSSDIQNKPSGSVLFHTGK